MKIEVIIPKSLEDHARLRELEREGKLAVGDNWMAGLEAEPRVAANFDPAQDRDEHGRWVGDKSTLLYHGTSSEIIQRVKHEGLLPGTKVAAGQGYSNSVWTTPELDVAKGYAKDRANYYKTEAVILRIQVPEFALKNFKVMGSGAHVTQNAIPPSWITGVITRNELGTWSNIRALEGGRTLYAVILVKEDA